MMQRQIAAKLATTAVASRRRACDRYHLAAARLVCAGSWLAYQSSTLTQYRSRSDSNRQESDCPLCQQFGRGPCKDVFYSWYDCTDEAAASGRSEDEITQDCAELFDVFRACLDRQSNSTHESGEVSPPDFDPEDMSPLRDAWHQIIHSDLASVRREPFPPKKRPVINRASESWQVSFDHDELVLVFVQMELPMGGTEIVAAASGNDLIQNTIRIPSDRLGETMIISAVYEKASDAGSDMVVCEERIDCHGS